MNRTKGRQLQAITGRANAKTHNASVANGRGQTKHRALEDYLTGKQSTSNKSSNWSLEAMNRAGLSNERCKHIPQAPD